jgi:hypothetical protein
MRADSLEERPAGAVRAGPGGEPGRPAELPAAHFDQSPVAGSRPASIGMSTWR